MACRQCHTVSCHYALPLPEALVHEFSGKDFVLDRVSLPAPTQDCVVHRRQDKLRCSVNKTERLGDPLEACDELAEALRKVVSTAL